MSIYNSDDSCVSQPWFLYLILLPPIPSSSPHPSYLSLSILPPSLPLCVFPCLRDADSKRPRGKLRLLNEVAPLSFLVEQVQHHTVQCSVILFARLVLMCLVVLCSKLLYSLPSLPPSLPLSLPLFYLSIRLEARHLLALVAFLTQSPKGCMITSPASWAHMMTSLKRRNTSEPSDSCHLSLFLNRFVE